MIFNSRNVSFRYPGTDKDVLKNVSFKITPGQLVVMVGVNGSGKSSTIKLFNRIYDPTEGEILLDDQLLSSYKLDDIRRSMAILRQDHTPYPVSIRQNVTLGLVDRIASEDELENAIEAGGAHNFINKLPKKLDTILTPVKTARISLPADTNPELEDMVDEREKAIDLSGGETQRLSA